MIESTAPWFRSNSGRSRASRSVPALSSVWDAWRGSARADLLVADDGVAGRTCGYGTQAPRGAGVDVFLFKGFGRIPTARWSNRGVPSPNRSASTSSSASAAAARSTARRHQLPADQRRRDMDYRGYGKVKKPLLPMIRCQPPPGPEAGSRATRDRGRRTHMKMACGDPSAAFRVALLDPSLTLSAAGMTAIAGFDAVSRTVKQP